jgi:hypothetical protein
MSRLGVCCNAALMLIVLVALFMVLMALRPAAAQRCPAGADAFGSCLPLDHRYGGPGSIQQLHPKARAQRATQQPHGQPPINMNPQTGRPYNTETPVYCTRDRWLRGLCK